jgi:hypothetical protein
VSRSVFVTGRCSVKVKILLTKTYSHLLYKANPVAHFELVSRFACSKPLKMQPTYHSETSADFQESIDFCFAEDGTPMRLATPCIYTVVYRKGCALSWHEFSSRLRVSLGIVKMVCISTRSQPCQQHVKLLSFWREAALHPLN